MASATVAFNAIVVEALNEHNYRDWSSQIETYLLAEEVWDVVKSKQEKAIKDWRRKDAKALHAIKVCCGKEAFSLIRESNTAKIAWEVLEKKFNSSSCGSTPIPERKGRDEEEDIVLPATTNDSGQILYQREALVAGEDLESQAIDGGSENSDILKRFFGYVKDGHLQKTMKLLEDSPGDLLRLLLSARDPESDSGGNTALHIAVAKGYDRIVKKLVKLMGDQRLTLRTKNYRGETALHTAVTQKHSIVDSITNGMSEEDLEITDNEEYTALGRLINQCSDSVADMMIALSLIGKNRKLLTIESPKNHIPVVEAAACRRWDLCHYLFYDMNTPIDALVPGNVESMKGSQGVELLSMCIRHPEGLDIASDLLKEHPKLAFVENRFRSNPLSVLARLHFAFLSGSKLTFWQKLIYNCVYLPTEDDHTSSKMVVRKLINVFILLLGYYKPRKMKGSHFLVLKCMRLVTSLNWEKLTPDEQRIITDSVLKAIEHGHLEFVTHMCNAYPLLVDTNIGKEHGDIFQHTIECRQGEIFNSIYMLKMKSRNEIGGDVSDFDNSLVHVAAKYSPRTRSNQDASLQMQRELQWFKVVESIVPFETLEYVNGEGLTARELFTDSHVELKKEAEKAIKGTATACTTVGALIVTIMFAVAFTVPGGTNTDTGLPVFLHKKLFRIFILSDTISLISSSTSVITFLGLLTSTYAEDDFLWSLPKKMMIGLSTLFISIAAMMITFSCSLTIMLDGEKKMIIPVIVFATVPVVSFAYFLIPLLYEIWRCTYGHWMIRKEASSFSLIAYYELQLLDFCIRNCPHSRYSVMQRLLDMRPSLLRQLGIY